MELQGFKNDRKQHWKRAMWLLLLLAFASMQPLYAQKPALGKKGKNTPAKTKKSTQALTDTLPPLPVDTVDLGVVDTLAPAGQTDASDIRYSKDSLDAEVTYKAVDSMVYDIKNSLVYLYGDAEVTYDDMKIKADYIQFDWNSNIATAEVRYDSLGNPIGSAIFEDPENNFEALKMRYNFKTQKGKVYDVRTQEGDGFLLSQGVKFDLKGTTGAADNDVIYADKTLYTTCDAPHPHFGIRSTKAKIIPNKLIVVGPSNLVISDVPTPLWLPFGFFPITKGRRSGIIFPRDFEFDREFGYGVLGFGYYFGLNDYMDLSISSNLYSRGSWLLSAGSSYRKRYKYSGNYNLNFSRRVYDSPGTPDYRRNFDVNISWTHSQDSKAHPSRTFTAGLNIGTGTYYRNNYTDSESALTNTLSSNVSFTKRWLGKPYTFTTSFRHSQQTNTGSMTITFPQMDFRVNTIFPFKRKKALGKEAWYEKVQVSYTTKLQNRLQTIDTLLFGGEVDFVNDMRYGWDHSIPVSANFKILKYFNLSPSVTFTSKWHLQTTEKQFLNYNFTEFDTIYNPIDTNLIDFIVEDTVSRGLLLDYQRYGFKAQNELRAAITLNTTLFGLAKFKFKRLKAIRHQVKPSLTMSVTPDYTKWGYFRDVEVESENPVEIEDYSIFENNNLYGDPSRNRTANLSWAIGNVLEAKVANRRDSTGGTKKVKILDNFNINGAYNFAADSFKHSNITMNGRSRFFKVLNLNYGATFSPYYFVGNRAVNISNWKANKRLLNFRTARLTASTSIKPEDISGLFGGSGKREGKQFISALSFNYTIRIGKVYEDEVEKIDITSHSIGLSRTTINLTKKWRIGIGNISYDFRQKRFSYPDFSFYRDLHCWEMGVDTQPTNGSFSFFLRVKPGTLDFLNIPYRKGSRVN